MSKRKAAPKKSTVPPKKVKETRSTTLKKSIEEEEAKPAAGYEPVEKPEKLPDTPWTALIRETKIRSLVEKKPKLITISEKASLGDAMKILNDNQILSLPVVNERSKKFLGFIDVLDITGFVLTTWKQSSVALSQTHFPTEEFFKTKVIEARNFSNVNYPVYIDIEDSVQDAIDLFTDPRSYFRLHRLAVMENKKVVNIISQTDIIRFADANVDKIGAKDIPIGGMTGLMRSPLLVRCDTPFVEALEILFKNRVSGLVLVDHEFKVVGNLSASDLRGMNALAFDFFNGSVLQFLIKGTDTAQPKLVPSAKQTDTFGEVLNGLKAERVHRLWITDGTGHPIGFISMIDAIARLNI
jgi:CBS domain-containing protein